MEKKYYIQRTGEVAKDIWRFFQVVATLGVLDSEPSDPSEGDVYVNSITFQYGLFTVDEGVGSWSYASLVSGDYVYDEVANITYRYDGSGLVFDYGYEGISVTETDNISSLPDRKDPYFEDWKDEQGDDTDLPSNTFYKSKTVTIDFFLVRSSLITLRNDLDIFLKYATAKGYVNYFDTLKGQGFRGYYKSHDVSKEKYRNGGYWQQFKITFTVDKLCYGYDCTQCSSLAIDINEDMSGFYDMYLSDGTQLLKYNEDAYVSSENCKFVIIVPDFLDLLTISCTQAGAIGIDSDGQYTIGIEGETFILGV